jgi:signal transduction histidine kinase
MSRALQFLQVLLVGSLLFSVSFLAYCLKHRDKRGARSLAVVFFGLTIWLISELVQMHTGPDPMAYGGIFFRFLGVDLTVFGALLFGLEYTGRDQYIRPQLLGLLAIKPVATGALVLSDYQHLLFEVNVNPAQFPWGYQLVQTELFVVHVIYSYIVLIVAIGMAAYAMARATHAYGRQIFAILFALSVPLGLNILFTTDVVPFDLTPSGFLVTAAVFMYATFRLRLMDTIPIARRTVIAQMDEMVFLLDETGNIETVNQSVIDRLGEDENSLRGRHVSEFLGDDVPADGRRALAEGDPTQVTEAGAAMGADDGRSLRNNTDFGGTTEITTTIDGETRHLTINRTLLTDHRGTLLGQLLVCRDVTERKRRERKLERQNERLDRFASMISHDLRNPLNVAQARTGLAEDTGDEEHFAALEEAHERMDTMIDDMLTMARAETAVDEVESASLQTIAENAWDTVQTDESTLESSIAWNDEIDCNPDLLQNIFENLYRNAIEHNETPVTVRIGLLEDDQGFFVEDDGSGIPPEERDDVFEYGYTAGDSGTGLGLAIVNDLVEAHGWSISVTESDEGGARFEIRTTLDYDRM